VSELQTLQRTDPSSADALPSRGRSAAAFPRTPRRRCCRRGVRCTSGVIPQQTRRYGL